MSIASTGFEKFEKIPLEWRIAAAVSIALHLFFLILVTFCSEFNYDNKKMPAVIDVDLSWLSAPAVVEAPETVKKKSAVVQKKKRKVKKKAKVKKKTKINVNKKKTALKTKNKKNKKKVAKSKDIINDAIERLKKDLDKTEPDSLADRMKQLEKEIRSDDRVLVDTNSTKVTSGAAGQQNPLISSYISYVTIAVQENWAFSKNLAGGGKDLKTTISFVVMPDGEIRGVRIEKKSGNNYMDSAASMAVVKAGPVKPFPVGLTLKHIEMRADFSPQ